MKFRFRILSNNTQHQRDVRNFGLLLLVIGFCLHDPGQSSLKYLGLLLLLWSGMSWLTQKACSAGWLPDSAWVHVAALAVLILLDIQIGSVIHTTESVITTFSKQVLQQELSKPPKKTKPIARFKHGNTIRSVAFSPVDASLLASAGGDTVKLWDQNAPDPLEIFRLEPYTDDVESIAFSPDGERLVSVGNNGITLWNVLEKHLIKTFDYDTGVVAFSPDGKWMAEAAWDLNLWNISEGINFEKTALFKHDKHNTFVPAIAFSPDGKWLVSGDTQGKIKVWDVENARVAIPPLNGGNSRIRDLAFSPKKNKHLLASAGADGDVKLWRTQDWQITHRISTGTVLDIAFSPDGNTLAGVGWDTVNLWAAKNGAHIAAFKKRSRSVAFSPDGTTFATGGTDGTLRIWDVAPDALSQQSEPQNIVRLVYFLPKGARAQLGIRGKIDKMIRKVQHFYASQLDPEFAGKTFTFETHPNGDAQVYIVTGKFTAAYYLEETLIKVEKEISKHLDVSRNVYFVVVELGSKRMDDSVCGQGRANPIWSGGSLWQVKTGAACIPTFKNCFNWETAAHELGHAFGLKHDFRNDDYLMSYGKTPDRLSKCAAHWLSQTRFFYPNQQFFDQLATIEMLHSPQGTQFEITDADGIHQVQLLVVPTNEEPPSGYTVSSDAEQNARSWQQYKENGNFMLDNYHRLNGEEQTVIGLQSVQIEKVRIQVIDVYGNITWRRFALDADAEAPPGNP